MLNQTIKYDNLSINIILNVLQKKIILAYKKKCIKLMDTKR